MLIFAAATFKALGRGAPFPDRYRLRVAAAAAARWTSPVYA